MLQERDILAGEIASHLTYCGENYRDLLIHRKNKNDLLYYFLDYETATTLLATEEMDLIPPHDAHADTAYEHHFDPLEHS